MRASAFVAVLILFAGCVELVDSGQTVSASRKPLTTSASAGTISSSGSASPSATGTGCGWMSSEPCDECPWKEGCTIPSFDENAPIKFVFGGTLKVGGAVDVKIRNDGTEPYKYSAYYESCQIGYYTEGGRRFLVPPGTHCDIANEAQVKPGETVTLFKWDLDECTKDQWGCAQKEDLPAGKYHLRDNLTAPGSGAISRSGATITIAP